MSRVSPFSHIDLQLHFRYNDKLEVTEAQIRPCLINGNVPKGERFFARQGDFSQEYLVYCRVFLGHMTARFCHPIESVVP